MFSCICSLLAWRVTSQRHAILQTCSDQVLGQCLPEMLEQNHNIMTLAKKKTTASRDGERFLHSDPNTPKDFPKILIYRGQQILFCTYLDLRFCHLQQRDSSYNIKLIAIGTGNSKIIWLYTRCFYFFS